MGCPGDFVFAIYYSSSRVVGTRDSFIVLYKLFVHLKACTVKFLKKELQARCYLQTPAWLQNVLSAHLSTGLHQVDSLRMC